MNAVHLAAQNGHAEAVILLHQHEVAMNVQAKQFCIINRHSLMDISSHTPFTFAINNGHIDTAKTINFKEMHLKDVNSIANAIVLAAFKNQPEVLASLEKQIDGLPHSEETRKLVQIAKTVHPTLLLHKLIETKRIRLPEWLLQSHADFYIKNERANCA